MEPIAYVGDTFIAVRPAGPDDQEILVQATPWGKRMAALLSGTSREERIDGHVYLVVPHDEEADRIIRQMVEAFIALRYAHPRYVQLPLLLLEREEVTP